MDQNRSDSHLLDELENAAQGRQEGRGSRWFLAIFVTALGLLVIPPFYVLGWLGAVLVTQAMDSKVFKVLGDIRNNDFPRRLATPLAMTSVALSTSVFATLSPMLWLMGGMGGKLLGTLMLSSSLVHISLYLSRARFLYIVSIAPFVAVFAYLPLHAYFFKNSIDSNDLAAVFGGIIIFLIGGHKAYRWVQELFDQHEHAQKEALREKEKTESANAHLLAVNQALDTHAMVTRSTPSGVLLEVNDAYCEKTQYSREELIGQHHGILDTGYHSADFFEKLQSTLNAGKVWNGQIQNKAKDDSIFWGDTTISPIKNSDGKIIECISIRRDITDLLEAREQAERANQAKSEFLAMMSHELRTPMNAVLGMASLLKATELDDQQREYITAVTDGGEMLMTVLNDILDLSKIEAGKMQVETIDVDVRHAVKRLERLWAPNAKDKGLNFVCAIADNVPSVIRGDITRIRQIIYNLLSNAVKFTETGEVRLSVTAKATGKSKSQLSFAIIDTGVGISTEAQGRLFSSFEQADKSVTRKFGGTGLGLAISKKLAQLMDGNISVTSTPGKGTCFTFTLNAVTVTRKSLNENEVEKPCPASPASGKGKKQLRILAAEDNALNQRVLKAFLQPFNYDLVMVEDGVEALEHLATQSFDLVLMDVQMPRKDGMTTTQELRASGGPNANIPVIAMTANAMSGDRQKCMDIGMTDYVAKPIDPRVLITAIARASTQKAVSIKATKTVTKQRA